MLAIFLSLALASPTPDLDVLYSRAGGEELRMDIYSPSGSASAMRPAVLVIHGGAWMSGRRQDMAHSAQALADQGFVAATTSYRLAPKSKWPAMLDDVQTAVRFLRKNAAKYGIDQNRIGSAGASAGGHLALMLGFRDLRDAKPLEYLGESSRVSAVFNIFGPTDMRRDFPTSLDVLYTAVLGKPRAQASEEIADASPVRHIDKGDAPVFTIHGKADPLVPFVQAQWLDENLKKAGIVHELHLIEGMGHSIDLGNPAVSSAMQKAVKFLQTHLAAKG